MLIQGAEAAVKSLQAKSVEHDAEENEATGNSEAAADHCQEQENRSGQSVVRAVRSGNPASKRRHHGKQRSELKDVFGFAERSGFCFANHPFQPAKNLPIDERPADNRTSEIYPDHGEYSPPVKFSVERQKDKKRQEVELVDQGVEPFAQASISKPKGDRIGLQIGLKLEHGKPSVRPNVIENPGIQVNALVLLLLLTASGFPHEEMPAGQMVLVKWRVDAGLLQLLLGLFDGRMVSDASQEERLGPLRLDGNRLDPLFHSGSHFPIKTIKTEAEYHDQKADQVVAAQVEPEAQPDQRDSPEAKPIG